MLKEFKNFIMTGNVIDFAVAVIMAGCSWCSNQWIRIGYSQCLLLDHFAGGMDFASLKVVLDPAVPASEGLEGSS